MNAIFHFNKCGIADREFDSVPLWMRFLQNENLLEIFFEKDAYAAQFKITYKTFDGDTIKYNLDYIPHSTRTLTERETKEFSKIF